ncbi:transporter substrate-binding domain-containing protein [Slackia heliotrinireducens]|jgi:polar amino acid transport system substrate-binding protein|uniref:transporter substrate-binding domain-containing protein n=1 Tax=Slackia heliotrinireducens TaxID=84110 RepID=UPI00331593EB
MAKNLYTRRNVIAMGMTAAASVSLFGLVGCGGGAEEEGAFIVGFDAEYPPYGYLADPDEEGYVADDGQTYTGFDLDLANEVCARNGWTLKVQPIDWDSKDALLGSGDITCIWNGFTYEGREDQYAWSEPYMINAQVVVVKADSDIDSLEDLAGKNVITQAGSAALTLLSPDGDYADLAATFNGGAVSTIAAYTTAFMQLEQGTVDAVACDLSIAISQMNANPDAYKQLDEQLSSEHYAVGFALGQEDMAQTVTDTLKEMDAEGFVEELCAKYEGDIDYANWCLGA